MKILIAHTGYRDRGGEDVVVEREAACLGRRGHSVKVVAARNADLPQPGIRSAARLATNTIWNPSWMRTIRASIQAFEPDVVHVHNTFPAMSPAVLRAVRATGTPLVVTFHNYRGTCVNALLLRDGRPCELCVGSVLPWQGVVHRCYRDSRAASAVVAATTGVHRLLGTWRDVPDVAVVPGRFAASKLQEAGVVDPRRVVIKPNFVGPDPGARAGAGRDFVFVGRLSAEKGVDNLLRVWLTRVIPDHRLVLVGGGPLLEQARAAATAAPDRIEVRGQLPMDETAGVIRSARALLFTSIWYEVQPTVILEAFAHGVPVVSVDLGGAADLVRHGANGLLAADVGTGFMDAVATLATDEDLATSLGRGARADYEQTFSEQRGGELLEEVYALAIRRARTRTRGRAGQPGAGAPPG